MKKRPELSDILEAASHVYGVSAEFITRNTRKKDVIRIRQIVHYLARHLTNETLADIGKEVGNKNHATVMHSIQCVASDYEWYYDTQYLVDKIMIQLAGMGLCVKTNTELWRDKMNKENEHAKKIWQQLETEGQGMTSSVML